MKVYFDQNVWHCIIDNFSANKFTQAIKNKQMEICLGLHNIYEFGRCFLDRSHPDAIEKGKEIFGYLSELNVAFFLKETREIIKDDLDYAYTGGRLLPWLDEYNIVAAKEEIFRLSKGWSDRASEFIQKREKDILEDTPKYRAAIVKANLMGPKPKSFDELLDDWGCRRDILNQSEFRKQSNRISDSTLFSRQDKYPYLNTYINAQLYFNFIALINPTGPSKKSTSDYRHLINANTANYFVTDDKKIQKNSQKICPYIQILTWNEFKCKIGDSI